MLQSVLLCVVFSFSFRYPKRDHVLLPLTLGGGFGNSLDLGSTLGADGGCVLALTCFTTDRRVGTSASVLVLSPFSSASRSSVFLTSFAFYVASFLLNVRVPQYERRMVYFCHVDLFTT